jgi:hypothetical protein
MMMTIMLITIFGVKRTEFHILNTYGYYDITLVASVMQ